MVPQALCSGDVISLRLLSSNSLGVILIQEFLLSLKPRLHVLVPLQETLVNAFGEPLQQAAQFLLRVFGTDTHLPRETKLHVLLVYTSSMTAFVLMVPKNGTESTLNSSSHEVEAYNNVHTSLLSTSICLHGKPQTFNPLTTNATYMHHVYSLVLQMTIQMYIRVYH